MRRCKGFKHDVDAGMLRVRQASVVYGSQQCITALSKG